jgi:hypothetical protein
MRRVDDLGRPVPWSQIIEQWGCAAVRWLLWPLRQWEARQ